MKESIYTIPISEVFEPRQGCPLCALQHQLEDRWVQYITGAAMMEPDVRIATNREGFCERHLQAMLEQHNRLSVALLLQTRLEHILAHLDDRPAGRKHTATDHCFVCARVQGEMARLCGNLATIWAREPAFRELYAAQEYLCFSHYAPVRDAAQNVRGRDRTAFLQATNELVRRGLIPAKADIDAFCKLFDHRSAGGTQPPQQVAQAVEGAAMRLCGDSSRFGKGT